MLFKLQKVPFIVVSTSASKHPSSVMVASCLSPVTAQWHRPGPGNRDPHKPFYDCDNAVNTQKDKNHTYREMTTHTGRETLKEQMIFSTL